MILIISAFLIILLVLAFILHSFNKLLDTLKPQGAGRLKLRQDIDDLLDGNSLVQRSLVKLENMAYKEREESAMPTRTKIADLVAQKEQLKQELNACGHANYVLRTTNKELKQQHANLATLLDDAKIGIFPDTDTNAQSKTTNSD